MSERSERKGKTMSIYAIADLHLSLNHSKPMNVFGDNWENHAEKIKENWIKVVKPEDNVLIPGDFSWETYLEDTYQDFEFLNSLPGRKILLKGNHDYWWTTLTSMRKFLEEKEIKNIDFIYNTAYEFENKIIAGTRGWGQNEEGEDKKLLKREVARLELSLEEASKLNKNQEKEIIVFLHYPPITNNNIINNEMSEFIKMMKKYEVKRCYYGHLHSTSIKEAVEGEYYGIDFKLISADGLNFQLLKI